jgi:hypothetical protein
MNIISRNADPSLSSWLIRNWCRDKESIAITATARRTHSRKLLDPLFD